MNPDTSPAARRHGADQLGVPPDAPPDDARTAFLRKLPAAGFLPAPPLCAAAAVLTGQAVPGATGAVAGDDDDGLRAEVAAFARAFWATPPTSRREKWRDLLDRSGTDPLLSVQLRRLEAGVDLQEAAHGNGTPRPRDVVGMIQSLFVLGPIERASRRREMLDRLPPPAHAWEAAAVQVARDFPAHAALEPALVERLSTWSNRPKAAARAVGRPLPTWGFQTQGGLQMPQVRPNVRPPAQRRAPAWTSIGLVFLVISLVRGLSSSSNPPSYGPTYSRPDIIRNSPIEMPRFTPVPELTPLRIPDQRVGDNSDAVEALRKLHELQSRPPSPSGPSRP